MRCLNGVTIAIFVVRRIGLGRRQREATFRADKLMAEESTTEGKFMIDGRFTAERRFMVLRNELGYRHRVPKSKVITASKSLR